MTVPKSDENENQRLHASKVTYNRWISYLNLSKAALRAKFYVISSDIGRLGLFVSPMKSVSQIFIAK